MERDKLKEVAKAAGFKMGHVARLMRTYAEKRIEVGAVFVLTWLRVLITS
jgi:hypothetical protein